MNARILLEDLRGRGVHLGIEGDRLTVDAPAGEITEKLKATLADQKPKLLKLLEWERRRLEEADRRGLVIKPSTEPGWIALRDPTTGDRHEVRESECLPGVVQTAKSIERRGGTA